MGIFKHIKSNIIVHVIVGYIFVASGLVVNFLQLCSCVIWPFSKHLYRKINVYLAYSHWSQFTFLAQWWAGMDVIMYLNPKDVKYIGQEHALAILNHKYDIDWLASWVLTERCGLLGSTKVFAKQMLRYVPLIGWAWYFTETIFLKREWNHDKKSISTDLQHSCDMPPGCNVTLLLFPEGTRFTEKKHQASLEVCRAKGYPELKHCLLPRPKGFIVSVHGLKGHFKAVYDCTVGYNTDGNPPTLMSIINGKPLTAHFYIERIPLGDVPVETEEETAQWLRQTFKKKDDLFDNFLKTGTFPEQSHQTHRRLRELLMWCFWAVLLCVPLFWYMISTFITGSLTQQLIIVVVTILTSVIVRWMIAVTEIKESAPKTTHQRVKKAQ